MASFGKHKKFPIVLLAGEDCIPMLLATLEQPISQMTGAIFVIIDGVLSDSSTLKAVKKNRLCKSTSLGHHIFGGTYSLTWTHWLTTPWSQSIEGFPHYWYWGTKLLCSVCMVSRIYFQLKKKCKLSIMKGQTSSKPMRSCFECLYVTNSKGQRFKTFVGTRYINL